MLQLTVLEINQGLSSHCSLIIFDSQPDRFYLFVCLFFQCLWLEKNESCCQNNLTLQELLPCFIEKLRKASIYNMPGEDNRDGISLRKLCKYAQLVWNPVMGYNHWHTMVPLIRAWGLQHHIDRKLHSNTFCEQR
jgi:hypothetical protein